MKINSILIGSLLTVSLMASCNNSGSKTGESESSGGGLFSNKDDDKKEANEIIAFNNSIVKVNNTQGSAIRTFVSNFDQFEQYVKETNENPGQIARIAPIMVFPPIVHDLKGIVYPDGLSKDFKPLVDQLSSSFDAIKEIHKEVSAYKSAEDWKEDKGKKLEEFREKATAEISKNQDAASQIFAKLKPLADKAEETILEGNPLKSQFIRSKRLLDLVQETTVMAYEAEDLNKLKADFKKSYSEIEKDYNDNKGDELPKDYQSKARTFGMYNDAINEYLGKMRIVQRELDAGTEISETALTSLDNASQNALRSYNSFVD